MSESEESLASEEKSTVEAAEEKEIKKQLGKDAKEEESGVSLGEVVQDEQILKLAQGLFSKNN